MGTSGVIPFSHILPLSICPRRRLIPDGRPPRFVSPRTFRPKVSNTCFFPGGKPISLTGDFLPKIIVRHDVTKRWYIEQGILHIGILDFLPDSAIV